ncbi:hypothetical protein BH23PLA1_BH23PLA1_37650 [soil metagenome]
MNDRLRPWRRLAVLLLALLWGGGAVASARLDEPVAGATTETAKQTESSREGRPGGPRVLTAEEAADLLRPPGGDDPYGRGPIDWRTIPPWRQAAFFGIRAEGRVFVFVVDCSGSMEVDLRLIRAKQELRRSIDALRFPQRYYIIFFNDEPVPMPGGVPRSTEHREKIQTYSWLRAVPALGGTDPRGALRMALGLRPDAVFLLSDGEFDPAAEAAILAQNSGNVPIHCIDLSGGAAGAQLQRIAEKSGGQYASR